MTSAASAINVLFPRSQVAARVGELGKQVEDRYRRSLDAPVLVGVLKGSSLFLADLVRAITIDVEIDFISISSYGRADPHSGVVRIVKDLENDIEGRDVLLVEDIVDTGLTLNYLRRSLLERAPRSLETITLLDKLARRIVPVPVDFSGFETPDVYVVGYGMDFQGRYRNVSAILAVTDFARVANDPALIADAVFSNS